MFLSRNKKKNISEFLSENFQFLVVKFFMYNKRRVFVMSWRSYEMETMQLANINYV